MTVTHPYTFQSSAPSRRCSAAHFQCDAHCPVDDAPAARILTERGETPFHVTNHTYRRRSRLPLLVASAASLIVLRQVQNIPVREVEVGNYQVAVAAKTCQSAAWYPPRTSNWSRGRRPTGSRRLHQGRRGRRSRADGADRCQRAADTVKVARREAGAGLPPSSRLECERLPSGWTTWSASPASSCLGPGSMSSSQSTNSSKVSPVSSSATSRCWRPAPGSISSSNSPPRAAAPISHVVTLLVSPEDAERISLAPRSGASR